MEQYTDQQTKPSRLTGRVRSLSKRVGASLLDHDRMLSGERRDRVARAFQFIKSAIIDSPERTSSQEINQDTARRFGTSINALIDGNQDKLKATGNKGRAPYFEDLNMVGEDGALLTLHRGVITSPWALETHSVTVWEQARDKKGVTVAIFDRPGYAITARRLLEGADKNRYLAEINRPATTLELEATMHLMAAARVDTDLDQQ